MRRVIGGVVGVVAALLITGVVAAAEEEEKKTGWTTSTDLSLVVTDGNSKAETFGFGNVTKYLWRKSEIRVKIDAVRSDTADDRFTLVEPGLTFPPGGTPPSPFETVTVEPGTTPDVEKYFVETRFDRAIKKKLHWHAGGSWDRDEDAGIINRYIWFAGVGNTWWDRDDLKFKTSYGFSYTDREERTKDPEKDQTFGGARFHWDYLNNWGKIAVYENDFTANMNLADSGDYSLNMINSVSVSLSTHLSLKVSLQGLYNAEPALEDVDQVARVLLLDPDGIEGTGDELFETVESGGAEIVLGEESIRKNELDTVFKTSLTVKF